MWFYQLMQCSCAEVLHHALRVHKQECIFGLAVTTLGHMRPLVEFLDLSFGSGPYLPVNAHLLHIPWEATTTA